MARTYSDMVDLGTPAPLFRLPAANPSVDAVGGKTRGLDDYAGKRIIVMVFTCNHCPYAQHVEDALIGVALEYETHGVQFITINANDAVQYPEDSFEAMTERAAKKSYPFPYLFDESQACARAYGAVCTPDFFVFDQNRLLTYRGRFDDTRPGKGISTGADLRKALDEVLHTGTVSAEQWPSMGCNIKWKK